MRNYLAVAGFILLAVVLAASAGCRRAGASHDDHLEHHVPPHKPPDLRAAIDQIDERTHALEHAQSQPAAEVAPQLRELLDIVRWLPELAGDSDLAEADWNQVEQASRQMLAPVRRAWLAAGRGQQWNFASLHDTIERGLPPLRRIAATLPERSTADNLHHHHAHQHD
ncbi:MAG: hypothetical protein SFU86_21795 [Pirellulaceae bacterium]|nr:hypothetical protein [Pirellulaceae bacterium]